MRLLRLHIENFGALSDHRMELSEGLNVLCRQNGWGKSTLAAFIKAMLYGLPATTKRSLDENERKKYTPWQGGAFGGSLEFSCTKGSFRIERFFGAKESDDSFALYDLSTNLPSNAFSSSVGEELFGIDAEGFERTVYLSQRSIRSKGENSSITAKLGGLLEDVDDIGSFDDAMAALDKKRKYYVMTGNRGRIAELEQQRASAERDLEALLRVQSAAEEKEKARSLCVSSLDVAKKELGEVRTSLQRAGFLREQAALAEQKQRMLDELARLESEKQGLERRLCGHHPTGGELSEQRALLDRIREQTARLHALQKTAVSVEKCEILPVSYRGELPDGVLFFRLTGENNQLQELSRREEGIRSQLHRGLQERFPKGTPTKDEIRAAFLALEKAKRTYGELEKAPSASRQSPILTVFLAILAALSVGVCAFGAVLQNLVLALAGGALLLVFGAAALISFLHYRKASVRAKKEEAALQEKKQSAHRAISSVRAFLSAYGMSGEADPERSLTELSILSEQYRAEKTQNGQLQQALAQIREEKQHCISALQQTFQAFGIRLPVQSDYRDELEALHRDVKMLQNAQRAREEQDRSTAALTANVADLKAQLAPFLNRYDPAHRLPPEDCVRRVEEWENEYRRLSAEITQKTEALGEFMAQKKPQPIDPSQHIDVDYLKAEERRLSQRAEALQKQGLELEHSIESLTTEAERIPEVRSRISALEEEYTEAVANKNTVVNTQKLLEEAKTALSTRYLSGMQESFDRFLSVLFSTDAPESVMDPSFEVSLRRGGKTRSMESFSRGWRDAVQFCIRLSLTDALYAEGEKPFLLLDDPFVNLDEERLLAAKQLLAVLSEDYQIIYMVCHAERE